MATKSSRSPFDTFADVYAKIGRVPPRRVLMSPTPGLATEADLIRVVDGEPKRLVELIDGVLVEKAVGTPESFVGGQVFGSLQGFLNETDLGFLLGADGLIRFLPGVVRLPDVSYFSWERLGTDTIPMEPITDVAPELAVEVLSPSNTRSEMRQKLKHYFLAGVRLVWLIDPRTRSAQVFTAPDQRSDLTEADSLVGGEVLPGFELALAKVFARLAPPKPRRAGRKRRKS